MARRAKQLEFLNSGFKRLGDSFGGSLLTSNPKVKRPLDSKYATLVTLRSNRSGMRSFSKFHQVSDIVHDAAGKYGIKIYDFANVGNHLHILLKLSHKRFWTPFIREITSKIAPLFKRPKSSPRSQKDSRETDVSKTGQNPSGDFATKRSLANKNQFNEDAVVNDDSISTTEPLKFWKYRLHTRIIRSWKKAFKNAKLYLELNKAEANGHINRAQTKTLKDYRALFEVGMVSIKSLAASP